MTCATHDLIHKIEELPHIAEFYEEGETAPSQDIIRLAESIVRPVVESLERAGLHEADVHPTADGSIVMQWDRDERVLKLVVPAHAAPYLYNQAADLQSWLTRDTSESSFADLILWLSADSQDSLSHAS